ncbi:hypothetical protein CBR_g41326 [Chara braunii]|uniref:CCHC-type domain-containing protein n=1 Tax=Chara braunii TaxID=69332 RepID=A0A388LVR0_CHABU|nr:hypothetical protein CBR_g41326 [Chara braunii]|eukprot:GBG86333.1 hypothetical protein CBR_g41326 [Chara braunii]
MECFNCNGDGHFARECPIARGNPSVSGNSAAAPSTPRFWTPRRTTEDNEEREFLRQIIQEKKDEQARKRELDEQRKFDDILKAEMARYAEATKVEVMATVGRQYLGQKDEARREELKRGWSPPPRRKEMWRTLIWRSGDWNFCKRRGAGGRRPYVVELTSISLPSLLGRDQWRTRRLEESVRVMELATMKQDELKRICAREGLQYDTKGPSIDRIVAARAKIAYEGFIFSQRLLRLAPQRALLLNLGD